MNPFYVIIIIDSHESIIYLKSLIFYSNPKTKRLTKVPYFHS